MTELLVGRVTEVKEHPGSRAPSLLLHMDFGPRGEYDVQLEPGDHSADELYGKLLVASLNADGSAIVLAARSHTQGAVPLILDRNVEPGTIVA